MRCLWSMLLGLMICPMSDLRGDVVTLTTADASQPNIGIVRAFLGTVGGDSVLLATLDGLTLDGTATVDLNLSPDGNGTARLIETNLQVSDVAQRTIDLGPLGTIQLMWTGLNLNVQSSPISVHSNEFLVTAATGGGVTINGGTFQLFGPTGAAAALLPFGVGFDFASSPLFNPFWLIDPPIQGKVFSSAAGSVLTLGNPTFTFNSPLFVNQTPIAYIQYELQIQMASVVPEVHSLSVVSLISVFGIPMCVWRRWQTRPSISATDRVTT